MIRLRPYEETDLESAFELDQVCFPFPIAYTREALEEFTRHRTAYSLVAESVLDGVCRMVGVLVANHRTVKRPRLANIVTIDVAPDARRQGVASKLMDAAEEHYRSLGCTAVTLEVAVSNVGAYDFYNGRGFKYKGILRNYYDGGADAYVLSKPLTSSLAR